MNLATKTLATIMLVAMLSLSATGVSALTPDGHSQKHREERQLERLYKHHDRRMELRASVLGISADDLREKLKNQSFEQVVKKAGFKDIATYHTALVGKIKEELRKKGWDDTKVQSFIQKRLDRYAKSSASV